MTKERPRPNSPRPGVRPMRALPLLEARRAELETCVFCPKLCRSACPVSNAEPRETLTPWGKMSLAWMAAHGDVPGDLSHAAPAWACTGCLACRQACDHRNPVAEVLLDARDALVRGGSAPAAATRVLARFVRHDARTKAATRALAAAHPSADGSSKTALLLGCAYVRGAAPEAHDAVTATAALAGGPVALVEGCCGLPLRMAGDTPAFAAHARAFAGALRGKQKLIVVDAGCAHALLRRYDAAGARLPAKTSTFVELAAGRLDFLRPGPSPAVPVRWHDPCQLGRGLGIYDAPRAVLERILGHAPDEMQTARERAACAGGGGLLPATMPEVSRAIARARVEEHERAGGGRLVTGCAASLRALRGASSGTDTAVEDLVTVVANALRGSRSGLSGRSPGR